MDEQKKCRVCRYEENWDQVVDSCLEGMNESKVVDERVI